MYDYGIEQLPRIYHSPVPVLFEMLRINLFYSVKV